MQLDERKKKILCAIIDDYIKTAEPIGSRTIARKFDLGISPATIRNEMADLEEMGFLSQPHTSAGRIPSDFGYRFYVDELMKIKKLTHREIESIKNEMQAKFEEINQLIRRASYVLSKYTKYTSMSMLNQQRKSHIKAIQVVPLEDNKALVIAVTNQGSIKKSLVFFSCKYEADYLIRISNLLNERLSGLSMSEIDKLEIDELRYLVDVQEDLLLPVLKGVSDALLLAEDNEIYIDGTTNIFEFPEYSNIEKAKGFLRKFDEKDFIQRLLSANNEVNNINIKIGSENKVEEVEDCTLITSNYSYDDIKIGSLGIIGPTRMNYSGVLSIMNFIKNEIDNEIKHLFGE